MKKQIKTWGLVAAMVAGALNSAHAASQASVDFAGKIVKTGCDITLPNTADSNITLGVFAATEFSDMTTMHTVRPDPIMLDIGQCAGADLPASKSINLIAEQSNGAIPAAVKAAQMWGNNDLGVGIALMGAAYTGTGALPTSYTAVAPGVGLVLHTNSTADVETAEAVSTALPKSVLLKAGMKAYVSPTDIRSGDIKSSIVFAVAYD